MIRIFAFLLSLRGVPGVELTYPWDFPQTRSPKLQLLLTKEDEQQPLSVYLWAKKSWSYYFKNNRAALLRIPGTNHGTCQWSWLLLLTIVAICAKRTWTQSWSSVVKMVTLLLAFNQWEFSLSGETENSLFPQDPTAALFFSVPNPAQSSLPSCAGVKFSRDSLLGFNDGIKIRENRGLWTV